MTRVGKKRNAYRALVGKTEGKFKIKNDDVSDTCNCSIFKGNTERQEVVMPAL
jgi:hypothetical protein